jgi:hypothetical protein
MTYIKHSLGAPASLRYSGMARKAYMRLSSWNILEPHLEIWSANDNLTPRRHSCMPHRCALAMNVKWILLNALTFPACSNQVTTYSTLHPLWYQASKLYDSSQSLLSQHIPHWLWSGTVIPQPWDLFACFILHTSRDHWYPSILLHQWSARTCPIPLQWSGVPCLYYHLLSIW